MEKIRSGSVFYYRQNGAPSTVFSFTMTEEVDGNILEKALDKAIIRYPYFKVKIIKVDEALFLEENSLPFIVRNSFEDISLGSKENNFHLLDVHYFEKEIFVNFHHGMCDGCGIFPFIRTLLYCYCTQKYGNKKNIGAVRLPSSPILNGEDSEPCSNNPYKIGEPFVNPDSNEMYSLPELEKEYNKSYRWKIEIPADEMVSYMKSHDGSPSAFISLLMCKTIEKIHPEHDKPIAANVSWNCRHEIGFDNTKNMCLSLICLDYEQRIKNAPLDMQLTLFRGKTFARQMPENAFKSCNGMIMLSNYIESKTFDEKCAIMSSVTNKVSKSFLVSYVGQMDMGDNEQYIDGAYVYGSGTKGIVLEIIALKNKFCIQFIQSFEGNNYVQGFIDELISVGISSRVIPCKSFTTPRAKMFETTQ